MKHLLDTAIFLWSVDAQQNLSTRAREILEDGNVQIYVSPVVSWEIVIKVSRGKLKLARSVDETLNLAFNRFGLISQPITHAHSLTLGQLPSIHSDPFDRMLVAQAKTENMVLMTADKTLTGYPVQILWCGK
jgi:PIN domain nuclease of toxin-antitoxin system